MLTFLMDMTSVILSLSGHLCSQRLGLSYT